jgi:aerobic carbon-monoxide dehydrogenase medium subunit
MSRELYAAPTTLQEAVSLLAGRVGARVLAGGHSVLVEPNRSRIAGSLLVDLQRIPSLANIEIWPDGTLTIGALATLATIAESSLVRQAHPLLAETARLAHDPQTRNRATLGGALAGADPHADLPVVAMALNATVDIVGMAAPHAIPIDALVTGPAQTSLGPQDIITGARFPATAGTCGAAYERLRHPAVSGAICGIAAAVTLGPRRQIAHVRLAVTGATPHATRLYAAEAAILDQPASSALGAAAAAAAGELAFRSDHFASADYRRHLTRVRAERALRRAIERASV